MDGGDDKDEDEEEHDNEADNVNPDTTHSGRNNSKQGTEEFPLIFATGGSDSRLLVWRDVTRQHENSRLKAMEEELVLEQQLQNDIRNKQYGKVNSILC